MFLTFKIITVTDEAFTVTDYHGDRRKADLAFVNAIEAQRENAIAVYYYGDEGLIGQWPLYVQSIGSAQRQADGGPTERAARRRGEALGGSVQGSRDEATDEGGSGGSGEGPRGDATAGAMLRRILGDRFSMTCATCGLPFVTGMHACPQPEQFRFKR
jgi:hypothetical protein